MNKKIENLIREIVKKELMNEGKPKVGDVLTLGKRKGKVVKVMSDMANVNFNGDVYGIMFNRIKNGVIKEIHINEKAPKMKVNPAATLVTDLILRIQAVPFKAGIDRDSRHYKELAKKMKKAIVALQDLRSQIQRSV